MGRLSEQVNEAVKSQQTAYHVIGTPNDLKDVVNKAKGATDVIQVKSINC